MPSDVDVAMSSTTLALWHGRTTHEPRHRGPAWAEKELSVVTIMAVASIMRALAVLTPLRAWGQGWYLLVPPTTESGQIEDERRSHWSGWVGVPKAYDTAKECEEVRQQMIAN